MSDKKNTLSGIATSITLLFILASSIHCVAATPGCDGTGNCYVRAGATGGTQTGADWNNAYTDLPQTLTRGATYWVAGGTYHGHLFNDPDSGTTVITVKAPTSTNHGTDTGWSNSYQLQAVFDTADTSAVGDIFTFQSDYYVIDGSYRQTTSGLPETDWTTEASYGFLVNNSSKVACNADIDFGDNSNTAVLPVHNITIQYVDVNGSHTTTASGCREQGLSSMWGSHDTTIQYNYIHDTGGTILFMGGGQYTCSAAGPPPTCSSTPRGNYGSGANILVQSNYFARNFSDPSAHAEGCSCHEGLKNLTFAYNYWQDINGTAIIAPAAAGDWNTGNGGFGPWYVYGNVVFETSCAAVSRGDGNPGVAGFIYLFDSAWTGALYVFNNTFYNFPSSCNSYIGVVLGDGGYQNPMNAVYVQNNLFSNIGAGVLVINNSCPDSPSGDPTCTSITNSYNAYFNSPDAANDPESNVQYSTSSAPFVSATAYDFRLSSDTSPGFNTNTLASGNGTDLLGTTRGANGTWDRGAFQIAGTSQAPASPSGVPSAVVH